MEHQSKRKWLAVAFMFFSVAAFSLSEPPTQAATSAVGLCETCADNCRGEAYQVYVECRGNGGSQSYCEQQDGNYYNSCFSTFCSYGLGCPYIAQ